MTGNLKTKDKDGNEYFFKYEVSDFEHSDYFGKECKRVRVFIEESDDWFEAHLLKTDEVTMKSISMNNYGKKEYSGKGIPEAIIKFLSKLYEMNITSSSNKNTPPYEFRSEGATVVWKRLVAERKAKYFTDKDYYVYSYSNNYNTH